MKTRKATSALALTLAMASVPAMALNTRTTTTRTTTQTTTRNQSVNMDQRFRQMDRNGNGVIERGEWTRDAKMFDRLDTNRDNAVTRAELDQARSNRNKATSGNRFKGMDRNKDGRITRDEWRGNDTSFRNQDTDGNGVLSGSELQGKGKMKAKHKNKDKKDRD